MLPRDPDWIRATGRVISRMQYPGRRRTARPRCPRFLLTEWSGERRRWIGQLGHHPEWSHRHRDPIAATQEFHPGPLSQLRRRVDHRKDKGIRAAGSRLRAQRCHADDTESLITDH